MRTVREISELRQILTESRERGQIIGLVPTMGNLHDGHLALVGAARDRADIVVATIFINPMQFGPGEDLDTYPRTFEADREALETAGCDLVFAPSAESLYPRGLASHTKVVVRGVSEGLCGASRPGHFDGVATVVSMLFNLVQPDLACFGEKDYQQLTVIRRLVTDLHMPIDIVGVPTVRATDGLALSSRNGYLNEPERRQAPFLYHTLVEARTALEAGADMTATLDTARQQLAEAGFKAEYLELRQADNLEPVQSGTTHGVLLAAAHLGPARLIDNLAVRLPGDQGD
ncbi:pantoate--beta-alanine ligase [Aidingimonas halophila]|uniref:Pantothenate synthetase n=1 Tax=Aidingimonas halophila TaxID=574349 RepID=A0A1H2YC42_9GAMM|nr:pantoate--beta-alanine ligase [Aidingimonas halophila]GHC34792.1 pantothenate synthetase [Aidingimonas halophila]SDX02793.1 pantothenate synthetase [Aidingimonas halophila]